MATRKHQTKRKPKLRPVSLTRQPSPCLRHYLDSTCSPPDHDLSKPREQALRLIDVDDENLLKAAGKLASIQHGESFILTQIDTRSPSDRPSGHEYPAMLGSIACFEFLGFSREMATALSYIFLSEFQSQQRARWDFRQVAWGVLTHCPQPDVAEPGRSEEAEALFEVLGLSEETKDLFRDSGEELFDDDTTVMAWVIDVVQGRWAELRQVAAQSIQRGQEIRQDGGAQRVL
ncbi:hypothetical protein BKA67DRAFT_661719 [Truncatella angustata]|uniref:Uncharacterized protein n=1 Tax=Truncatella angustata TaxID=152316 RepID=A0A9P8ZT57_9PEZI|nr:uncharacterized protein BKA67DRAFT_661719 [Truncatella angustata]KAH6648770.1 hypothetical protein BKA67DRAFT_661719 [Truncatella angustata]